MALFVLFIAGLVSIVAGVALVSISAALIVAGVLTSVFAAAYQRGAPTKPPGGEA